MEFKNAWSPFRLFDELFQGQPFFFPFQSMGTVRSPQIYVDTNNEKKEYRISVELPGVTENEIKVTFNPGELEVRVDRKIAEKSELKFYRKIAMPDDVDKNKIKATLQNGILEIVIPFPTEADKIKSAHNIPVSKL